VAQPQQLHQTFQTTCAVPSGEAHVVVLDTVVLVTVVLGAVASGGVACTAPGGGR
jgi:hypothetical protein